MAGFGPQGMTELLDVKKDTFRYWREQLDPNPHRAKFSATDVLVYRIIKYWVFYQEEPVRTLCSCSFQSLFKDLKLVERQNLAQCMMQLDVYSHLYRIMPPEEHPSRFGPGIHYLPLHRIVEEHANALLTYGDDS